LQSTLRVGSS